MSNKSNEWVPVEKALPPNEQIVVAVVWDEAMNARWVNTAVLDGGHWDVDGFDQYTKLQVTHWQMPPALPPLDPETTNAPEAEAAEAL